MGARHPEIRLFGRSSECALLDQLVVDVRDGHSRTLVLRGDAGIGKTALLEYVAGSALGCRVVRIAGVESEMELAYAALHQFCGSVPGGLGRLPAPQREALSVAFGLRVGQAPDRFVVGLAVLGLVSEAAEQRPLVCLVDDAQWLDQVSAQTLAFVGRRLLAERVGMLFAVRDGAERTFRGLPERIVGALEDADARRLFDTAFAGPVDERVKDRIVAETRGNPLALIELPRGLAPEQLAGGFALPDSVPLASGIERSFVARLDSLACGTRRLLLVAAADPVGDVPLLWRAAARLGLATAEAEEATASGLVELGSGVRFRHPLVRSAIYRAASAEQRRSVHRALADVTDAVLDPDRHAWHRAQAAAAPDETVAAELEGSADRARARGGAAAAAAFLTRAAALTPEPSVRAQRGLTAAAAKRDAGALSAAVALLVDVEHGPPDTRRAAEVLRLRGRIALDLQRGAEASRLLLSAARGLEPHDAAFARQTHLEALAAAMWADGPNDNDDVLIQAARAARAAPPALQPPRAIDLALDALALRFTEGFSAAAKHLGLALDALQRQRADRVGGRWLWAAGNNVAGIIAIELFDSEARYALSVEQVQAARDAGALVQLGVALHYLAHTNLPGGELTVAASQIEESCLITEATGNPPVAYTELALAAFRGREPEASALIRDTMQTAQANGQGRIVSFATYASAVLYNGVGRYDAARDAAKTLIDRNVIGYGSVVVGELAEAASRTGDHEIVQQAMSWIRERTAACPNDWSSGIEARIRAFSSDGDDADRLYRESINLLGNTRLRTQLARGHLLYGEWLRRVRRRVDARQQLTIAHELLVTMGLEAFAQRAARELEATGATARKRNDTTRDQLTAQERRIARLAGEGLTNPEIAAQLFLSTKTIEWHLRKVFTKLAISSRLQLPVALSPAEEHPGVP